MLIILVQRFHYIQLVVIIVVSVVVGKAVQSTPNKTQAYDRSVVVVVVVVVVVGQTVGSISSKTLAYDCLCTLELCTASMIATS